MTVYLVVRRFWEDTEILGVFDSKRKAQYYMKDRPHTSIEEFTINKGTKV